MTQFWTAGRQLWEEAASVLPPDDELLATATEVPQEWLDEEDPFEPINPPAEFKQVADEVIRKFAERWNIPANVIGGEQ